MTFEQSLLYEVWLQKWMMWHGQELVPEWEWQIQGPGP